MKRKLTQRETVFSRRERTGNKTGPVWVAMSYIAQARVVGDDGGSTPNTASPDGAASSRPAVEVLGDVWSASSSSSSERCMKPDMIKCYATLHMR